MKLFKNKNGSVLVEKILMAAFAVAGGGAVIVYGSNVLTNAKNTEITGILSGNGQNSEDTLNAHFDDSNFTVYLSAEEINSNSFSAFKSAIMSINDFGDYNYLSGISISMNDVFYIVDEMDTGESIWCYCHDDSIYANWVTFGDCYFTGSGITFFHEDTTTWSRTKVDVSGNFVLNTNNENFYNLIKPALITDLS